MIVSCPLEKREDLYHHVIGICPKICQIADSLKVLFWIIDGCHPEDRPMEFTKDNFYWCMGGENGIDSITDAFMLCPGTKLTQKLLKIHEYYQNAADHLSSAICLGISKHVQIPPHLRK